MPFRDRQRKRRAALPTTLYALAALAAISMSSDRSTALVRAAKSAEAAARAQMATLAASSRGIKLQSPPSGAAGSTVFIDPETGQLREPTTEELNDLRRQSAQTAEAPQPIVTETGFEGLRLGDDQMAYTVARKRADGTIDIGHAAGKKDAEAVVRRAASGGLVAEKETVHER